MTVPVLMPPMVEAQTQAWHLLMDLYERLPTGWALIGGQLVHLHCAERQHAPQRPTDDVDTVVDIRADPDGLLRFTETLAALGCEADTSGDGLQHRWRRDAAQVDVLLPDGIGERAAAKKGVGGAPTLPAPGTTQALRRTEPVVVEVAGRVGTVLRPNLVGALVGKAAARLQIGEGVQAGSRHCTDFVVLASMLSRADFRDTDATTKDRKRLRSMIEACRADTAAMAVEGADQALRRLARAAVL